MNLAALCIPLGDRLVVTTSPIVLPCSLHWGQRGQECYNKKYIYFSCVDSMCLKCRRCLRPGGALQHGRKFRESASSPIFIRMKHEPDSDSVDTPYQNIAEKYRQGTGAIAIYQRETTICTFDMNYFCEQSRVQVFDTKLWMEK